MKNELNPECSSIKRVTERPGWKSVLENETVWLTQNQMAELFQRDKSVISRHIKNVFEEGELQPEATVTGILQQFRPKVADRLPRQSSTYNLDVIISVGYRVKSHRGTQFRIWATQRLREYIVKGFALDDERLKRAGGGNYFEELLARIRDIRSSEKIFWRKVLEIYATSIDYDSREEASQRFFATVQNKMHWAAHGHTAAEIIHAPRRRHEAEHGTDELARDQADQGRSGHREELPDGGGTRSPQPHRQRLSGIRRTPGADRKPMYMRDWIAKLEDFLRLGDREILTHAGNRFP